MKILKLLSLIALFVSASSYARSITTYGRGEARNYYGDRFAACSDAQRAANYYAVHACRSQRGNVYSTSASACSCQFGFAYGRRVVHCAANARAACSLSYRQPPRYPGHGRHYPGDGCPPGSHGRGGHGGHDDHRRGHR